MISESLKEAAYYQRRVCADAVRLLDGSPVIHKGLAHDTVMNAKIKE